MMNEYIKPTTDIYAVNANNNFLEGSLTGGNEEGDGEQLSKGGDWEDDDDLDGGSAIW